MKGASGETNLTQKVRPAKKGRVGYGILATHYDRDGDGIFEEARRARTIYFDRNGDHIADLVEEDNHPFIPLEWDVDFDGVLEHRITSDEGYIHQWKDRRIISKPAPKILIEDRIIRMGTCELSEPKFRSWESLLHLAPFQKVSPNQAIQAD